MATASYPVPEEVRVTPSDAENMMRDSSLVVLSVTPTPNDPDAVFVNFWAKERGVPPPWIVANWR